MRASRLLSVAALALLSVWLALPASAQVAVSVFTTPTVAANVQGPWNIIPDGYESDLEFSSASTSTATEKVYVTNDAAISCNAGVEATASPNSAISNPSAAAHQGFIVRSYKFFCVAVSGWSAGTLTTNFRIVHK
jgi:hypothetical protein